VIAIDATSYANSSASAQYQANHMMREINKAYAGFASFDRRSRPIATGNWGCGAYAGDPQLKFALQWIAASIARCDYLAYYPFAEKRMARMCDVADMFAGRKVSELWDALLQRPASESVFDALSVART
jgi:poly(ADP-ribose) glycohydrolase